ncbi:MAG: hypothetical protein Q9227_008985 [Pyrenula ochraceoflavens]
MSSSNEAPSNLRDVPLDDGVLSKFPSGTKILSTQRFGTSEWTTTARLNVQYPDGTREDFFLKCAAKDAGRQLMEGEFHAMSELHKWMPNFVPRRHSWGKYHAGNPDTYFYLSQHIEMTNCVPESNQLCQNLAHLHCTSVSPIGRFGFHSTTCEGRTAQSVSWESSWIALFTKLLRLVCTLDLDTNGYWQDLDRLETRIYSYVIPRLIGILERDGRSMKPSLIHGDLWEGNTGTCPKTGDVYVFDAGAFYARNEMEIGNWRCRKIRFTVGCTRGRT